MSDSRAITPEDQKGQAVYRKSSEIDRHRTRRSADPDQGIGTHRLGRRSLENHLELTTIEWQEDLRAPFPEAIRRIPFLVTPGIAQSKASESDDLPEGYAAQHGSVHSIGGQQPCLDPDPKEPGNAQGRIALAARGRGFTQARERFSCETSWQEGLFVSIERSPVGL